MMRAIQLLFPAFLMATGLTATAHSQAMSAQQIENVRDSWIFVFDNSVAPESVQDRARSMVGSANGQLGHVYVNSIRGFSARMPREAAERLAERNPNIAYFEADQIAYPFPPPACKGPNANDPGCDNPDDGSGGEPPAPSAQITPWGITRVGGPGALVSGRAFVIDSGVDLNHPDLNVNVALSQNFVSRGRDNGGDDNDGHGTHVAGTIAAIDNDYGVVGVAPGAEIVSVRVLGNSGGTYADVIAGVDYVALVGQSGDVANMSLGGGRSEALNSAVDAASTHVFFSLAAGNDRGDANNYSPASANGPRIYTVASSTVSDGWSSFSNYGVPPVDCAAPGSSIESTYKDGGYATLSGTSMAAPHVAGILLYGAPNIDGIVNGDPDPSADYPICVR